jgi:pyridoxamine 5'-phosphate oxidase
VENTLPYLDERILDQDPILQFKAWFEDAHKAGLKLPDAMTLATATSLGKPSARMVLLKDVDHHGFTFYSSYESRKAEDLAANPYAALVFYWTELDRQVRVEGRVDKVPHQESDAYFSTRPREGQLSSLASSQSRVVESREWLDKKYEELAAEYTDKPIPRPTYWGGYRLQADTIEFWQQRFARLNDRILYTRSEDGTWTRCRLAP